MRMDCSRAVHYGRSGEPAGVGGRWLGVRGVEPPAADLARHQHLEPARHSRAPHEPRDVRPHPARAAAALTADLIAPAAQPRRSRRSSDHAPPPRDPIAKRTCAPGVGCCQSARHGVQAWLFVARMKRSEIRDRSSAAAHPRHPNHALRLPRFNAVQTPVPGFRDAASGLREATTGFHHGGRGRRLMAVGLMEEAQHVRLPGASAMLSRRSRVGTSGSA
jgi:hypothetical protein